MEFVKSSTKEMRKVQGILGETSFSVVLPKHIASDVGIGKGDYLQFFQEGNRIVLQKAETQNR
jgi:bifunctional DNA-binding transcriptional regulator/antitoxin component of YhaV-PrlF toxin-antitoxin module